jgi:PAS domain S-box-containing protein
VTDVTAAGDVDALRLYRDEVERLTLLVEASGKLLGSLSLGAVLPAVLDVARRLLAADAHALWRQHAPGEWRIESADGLSATYRDDALAAIQGRPAQVSLDEPLVVEDFDSVEWIGAEHRAAHAAEGNRAMVAVGLRSEEDVLGTLVFYYRRPRVFAGSELRAAVALANLAASAIRTAELYEAQARTADDRRFLAEAGKLLASSLDYETTLANVAGLAVPRFADWCTIDMIGPERALKRIAAAHVEPEKVRLANDVAERFPTDPDGSHGAASVAQTGRPELNREVTDERLVNLAAGNDELLDFYRRLGLRSSILVPLVVRGRVLGVITFVSAESGRLYDESDLALAEELASRAALAVDNALLYRQAQESLTLVDTLYASAPIGLAFFDRDLRYVRVNDALAEMNGVPADEHAGRSVTELFPGISAGLAGELRRLLDDDAPVTQWEVASASAAAPAKRRHWQVTYYPVRRPDGSALGVGATVVDLTERKRAEETLRFLAGASVLLAASLDYETTLRQVASLAVPTLAGQCIVDLLEEDGSTTAVAVAHLDPPKEELLRELRREYPPTEPEHPVREALETGRSVFLPELSDDVIAAMAHDERHAAVIHELGNRSGVVVPLVARGRILGAITLGSIPPAPPFTPEDVALAEELARRAAVAVDNARLYRAAEERAQASLALSNVGDGVVLVDGDGVIRLWNPAAEAIVGLAEADVLGRPAADAVPGWDALAAAAPAASGDGPSAGRPQSVPIDVGGRELWLSISAVTFPGGSVFAFRDLTDERQIEQMKADFIATVSHELRTPLAAIYGSALTLRRDDVTLEEEQQAGLLNVIASESDRLARIVNDILWTSRVDSGTMQVSIESCDGAQLARSVVEATRTHLPREIELALVAPRALPPVAADPDKVRQVLMNLVDNAIKYSPEGGRVEVRVAAEDGVVEFAVCDQGLGIPPGEQERVFEKFYRLDPNLTRGVGGTGLGLYICRELVRQMGGSIRVESGGGGGSMFAFDLPVAAAA